MLRGRRVGLSLFFELRLPPRMQAKLDFCDACHTRRERRPHYALPCRAYATGSHMLSSAFRGFRTGKSAGSSHFFRCGRDSDHTLFQVTGALANGSLSGDLPGVHRWIYPSPGWPPDQAAGLYTSPLTIASPAGVFFRQSSSAPFRTLRSGAARASATPYVRSVAAGGWGSAARAGEAAARAAVAAGR